MKRILFIHISGYPILKDGSICIKEGGLSHIFNVALNLKGKYDITVLCPNNGSIRKKFVFNGIKFICIGGTRWFKGYLVGDFTFFTLITYYIATLKFDIIIGNAPLINILLPLIKIKPIKISIVHDLFFLNAQKEIIPFHYNLEKAAVSVAKFLGVDGIIAVNESIRNAFVTKGFNKDKIMVTGNGADITNYKPSNKKRNWICFIGRFSKDKEVSKLLDVFFSVIKIIPDSKLFLIGDGPEKQELINRIGLYNLTDKVIIKSDISEDEKIHVLSNCKVYVSFSKIEGFGIPLAEAMACETVPVVRDIYAHRFVFQNREVGFLVKTKYSMINHIIHLLKDEKLRTDLASNGKKLVEDLWNWKKVAEKYDYIINLLLDEKRTKKNILVKSKGLIEKLPKTIYNKK